MYDSLLVVHRGSFSLIYFHFLLLDAIIHSSFVDANTRRGKCVSSFPFCMYRVASIAAAESGNVVLSHFLVCVIALHPWVIKDILERGPQTTITAKHLL